MPTFLAIYLTIMWILTYNSVEPVTVSEKEPLVPDRITKDDEFQYIVNIQLEDTIVFPLCIGTIIGRISVLTAAHCVGTNWRYLHRHLRVVAGSRYLAPTNSLQLVSRRVVKHTTHPRYNVKKFAYDIAVLTTEIPFQFDSNPPVTKVSLRSKPIVDGHLCEFLGWGMDSNLPSNATNIPLMATTVRVYSWNWCDFVFRKSGLNQDQICGRENCFEATSEKVSPFCFSEKSNLYQNTCAFDIGSPLICDNALVGIGTKRYKCEDLRRPHVFLSIPNLEKLKFYSEDESISFNEGAMFCYCHMIYVFILIYMLLIFIIT